MKKLIDKFKYAGIGVLSGTHDFSIRLQWILALLAFFAGWIMKLSYVEWLAVVLCIGFVVVTETLNTCIEKLCDLYSTQQDERIKYIKDLAAGGVLLSSVTAFICAIMILIHHI